MRFGRRNLPAPWSLEVIKFGRLRSGRLARGDDFVALLWGRNRRDLMKRVKHAIRVLGGC